MENEERLFEEMYRRVSLAITQESIGGNEMPVVKAKSFIVHGLNETKVLPLVQNKIMTSEKEDIDRLTMEPDQLRKPMELTEPETEGTVTWHKEQLVSEETILVIPISYRAIKRNVERERVLDTIDNMARRRIFQDWEKLAFRADSSLNEQEYPFLSQQDGWIKIAKAKGNPVNTNAHLQSEDKYKLILDALVFGLPEDYRDESSCVIFMNDQDASGYINELGPMLGGLAYLTKGEVPPWKGFPILKTAKVPQGTYMFTPTLNLANGIEQIIEKEVERKPVGRKLNLVYTFYGDFGVAVPEAISIAWDQGAPQ